MVLLRIYIPVNQKEKLSQSYDQKRKVTETVHLMPWIFLT